MDSENMNNMQVGFYPDKEQKSKLSSEVIKHMRNYLTAFKSFRDVEFKTNEDESKEQGFVEALKILGKWFNSGQGDIEGVVQNTSYAVHEKKFVSQLKDKRAVIWGKDTNGVKSYYTVTYLNSLGMNKVMEILTGLDDASEEYQGLNLKLVGEDGKTRVIDTVGVSFFQYKRKNGIGMKKADKLTGQKVDLKHYNLRTYQHKSGAFFPYLCTLDLDLSTWGIYSEINKNNYIDNCFVHACKMSEVFTPEEVDSLRTIIRCRRLPRKDIKKVAEQIKCNFIVSSINEEQKELKNQISTQCNTIKQLKQDYGRTVKLILYKEHYLLFKDLPISPYAINHYEEIKNEKEWWKIIRIRAKGKYDYGDKSYHPMKILRALFNGGFFRPISAYEQELIKTPEFKNKLDDYETLEYSEEHCCRLMSDSKKQQEYEHILYADFEADVTVNPHKAYLCCIAWETEEGFMKKAFRGKNCAMELLNFLPAKSLVYFHNLKYDASFFINISDSFYINLIQRCGKLMQAIFTEKGSGRRITFRDSYSIIPSSLKKFGDMFGLKIEKEVCPYKLYTEQNIKRKFIPLEECLNQLREENSTKEPEEIEEMCKQFRENCENTECLHKGPKGESVEIMDYAEFYCTRDCLVLMQGLQKFDKDLKDVFARNNKQWYGLQSYISISSIGYHFAQMYGCMDGCYELAGKPQDFICRCVSGGRTMCAQNKKQLRTGKLQDFDAVSLYPSAMSIMDGIPMGKPKVITQEMIDNGSLYDMDNYFIEIRINELRGLKGEYPFPLVFKNINGTKMFLDQPVESFYIDKRGLEDLTTWYDVDWDVIRGYYFNEGFNNNINKFIKELFNLRKRYQQEGNPLEKTLKLLLNSIYGKSILKPISTETVVVDSKKVEDYVIQHYNYISELTETPGCKHAYAKVIKPINVHFNLPQFGVNVLSWSKHIMNNVMCTAHLNNIPVYYQDTDSMHLDEENVPKLEEAFMKSFGKPLIGTELTQFHCDFDPIKKGVPVHSKKLIALGKKSYLDILEDDEGNNAYHIRMKGIPQPVIYEYCKKHEITIEDLYMQLYNGEVIEFNLLEGSNCFRKNKNFEMCTPKVFKRIVRF